MNIGIVPDPLSDPAWSKLVACAERGGSNEAELKAKIEAGHTVLWSAGRGILALDLTTDDVCVAWLGVGDMRSLLEQEPAIAEFAKTHGCRALRLEGRIGWLRKFKHWECKESGDGIVQMEREL